MKSKTKEAKIVLEISEEKIRILKISERSILESQEKDILEKDKIAQEINELFKRIRINRETIIICLPRYLVTLRYLKIPSLDPQEIEKISHFQSSSFLPYPLEDLISGYSLINLDKLEGYSYINLIVVHQNLILDLIRSIPPEFKNNIESIQLSSLGIYNWYKTYKDKNISDPVIVVEMSGFLEIAVVSKEKFFYSRAIKIKHLENNLLQKIIEEIKKTYEVYLQEIKDKEPKKIILAGTLKEGLEKELTKEFKIPIEKLDQPVHLLGMAFFKVNDSLNLLPQKEKELRRKLVLIKERIKLGILSFSVLFFFILGLALTFYNKSIYLSKLKSELNKITLETKELEEKKTRLEFFKKQALKMKLVDILSDLYQRLPEGLKLFNLLYEEDKELILRGEAKDLSLVFNSTSLLQESMFFREARVGYATKKNVYGSEVVDFEIICEIKTK
ncbi:MAG: hypothetical protein N2Z79_00700 [Candidatus Omnitrophica bacterium]|nr:hypothetical protein [Candidatus Omnitrophota bacterium]